MTKKKTSVKATETVAKANEWHYHSEGDFPQANVDIIADVNGSEIPSRYMNYLFYRQNGKVWEVIDEPIKKWMYADSDK